MKDFSFWGLFWIWNWVYWSWWDEGKRASASGMLEPACTGFYESIVKFSGIWRTSWHHVTNLKSAMVGMFTLQKSANATNQSSFLPSSWLLSISLHTTGFSYLKIWYISSPWVYFFPLAFFSYTYFPLMLSIFWQKLFKKMVTKRCLSLNKNCILLHIGENSKRQKVL